MGIGGNIFNFLGAIVRWIYGTIWRTLANKKKYSFREYLLGPDNSEDWFDFTGHGFVNKMIGVIVIIVICWLLILYF